MGNDDAQKDDEEDVHDDNNVIWMKLIMRMILF